MAELELYLSLGVGSIPAIINISVESLEPSTYRAQGYALYDALVRHLPSGTFRALKEAIQRDGVLPPPGEESPL